MKMCLCEKRVHDMYPREIFAESVIGLKVLKKEGLIDDIFIKMIMK
jgi:uncharacterized protein YciU (UPF0263 family)